jgi:hypothetical protein
VEPEQMHENSLPEKSSSGPRFERSTSQI